MVSPSPAQGVALRHLGLLPTEEVPMMAAHWLIEFDSPALRELAGLQGSEGWVIDQLWPQVMADLGVAEPNGDKAWDLAAQHLLEAWHAGERSATEVMRDVARAYTEGDYPDYPPEAGQLYGLDDEFGEPWGRGSASVLGEVERTLEQWASRLALSS